LVACQSDKTDRKARDVLAQSKFDKDVINSLSTYDSLKSILLENIDTIFQFRNDRHFVFHRYQDGDTGTVQEDANFYLFTYNSDRSNYSPDEVRKNLPTSVSSKVLPILDLLGEGKLKSFLVHIDSTIEIRLKEDHLKPQGLDVHHNLTWKKNISKDESLEPLFRDTLLTENWTYSIWVDKNHGW
jgi:hypothetical protein